ncbi:hypothetical protein HD806DRAFT_478283 [Xylariaceae sp. AK1471]|nr:hypothetical protein HD806DRAFT_478283 [Xylariaceae sp. AK1471]
MAAPVTYTDHDVVQFLCHRDNTLPQYRFPTFCRFYHDTIDVNSALTNPSTAISQRFLASPSAIIAVVSKLRSQCNTAKATILQQLFPQMSKEGAELCLRSIVKIAFMIDPASLSFFSDEYQRWGEYCPVQWKDDQSLVRFIESTFPRSACRVTATHSRLKAWKLEHRYGISIVPTNDLAQHLLYDFQCRVLTVFHQVAWLKAQLRYVSNFNDPGSTQECLARGVLPPRLLRETLFSIYRILFPLDEKSARFARRLVNRWNETIDPDFLIDPGAIHSMSEPFEFVFWGKRLERLEKVVANPPPSNTLVSWFERHTSERNVLTVAIVGVVLAAVFGFLSFIVSIVQLIISYQAWKFPV